VCSTGLLKFVVADGYTFVKFLICKEQHNSWYLPNQKKMAVLQISTLDFVTDRATDLPTVGPITRAKCYWTTCLERKSDNYLVGSRNPVRHNTVPDHRLIWTSSWSNAVELNHMILCLWKNTGGQRRKGWGGTKEAHTPYSAVHGFWPMEEIMELADGPTGCGEVVRGGGLFACNFRVTRTDVRTEVDRRTRPNMLSLH